MLQKEKLQHLEEVLERICCIVKSNKCKYISEQRKGISKRHSERRGCIVSDIIMKLLCGVSSNFSFM